MENLDDLRQNIDINVTTNADDAAASVDSLNNAYEGLTQAKKKDDKETKQNTETQKSLKTQLREATLELISAQAKYGDYSKAALDAAKKTAQLRDQIQEAKETAALFDPGAKFAAATGAINAGVNAIQTYTAGLGLLGVEGEEAQETLLKVQSAMALSQGISGILDSAKDFNRLKAVLMQYSVVQKTVTAAQWLWNAATAANPIVALVVAVVAAGAAIYKLTTYLMDSSKANEKAAQATAKATKAFEEQKKAADKSSETLKENNAQLFSLAEASGASSEQLRKLKVQHANEEVALAKKNTELAKSTFLRQRDTLEMLKNSGASDEVIEKQDKLTKSLYEEFKRQNEGLKDAYKNRSKIERDNQVEIVKEQTEANRKALERQKEHQKQLAEKRREAAEKEKEQRKQLLEALRNLENNYVLGIEDLRDKTEEQKLARQKKRDLEEIERLRQQGANVAELLILNEEKYSILEQELRDKREEERKQKEKEAEEKRLEDEKKRAEETKAIEEAILRQKEEIEDKKLDIASRGIQLISQIFGKSKAIQKAAIIAENAVGIGKMIIDNNRANIGALATPQAIATSGASAQPVIALNNISTGIGIASSIAATAKALSALGGGSAPSSQTTTGGATAGGTPQVGFQNSNENQISNSINRSREDMPPIQTYVVSQEVTNSQQIDRNRQNSNSF